MTRPRILIIDDDPALLEALPETLRLRMEPLGERPVVDTVDSALPALERMAVNDYDAVICDVKLPGMDGLSLLAEIRKLRPGVPTLLITGHGQHDLAVQALRGGAFDFIQKPIEREYLIASLGRAIHVHRLRRQVEEQRLALERHALDLEKTVEERTRELRESNQAKDDFLATLAHELRNPLAPIRNAVQLLQRCRVHDPTFQRARDIIDRQAGHMARLIDDLLDVSRIQRGRIQLQPKPLDLGSAVAHAVEACMPLIQVRKHEIDVSVPKGGRPVLADPTRLEQIICNLVQNAAKYTEPGGRISISAEDEGARIPARRDSGPGQWVLRIKDTGVGIAPELLPRIFEHCFQAAQSLERAQGGLGIGLTLVKHLVEMHGGNVQAFSAGPGQGSEFVVRLPCAEARLEETAVKGALPSASAEQGRRVLIVEDNADSRESLSDLLRLWGHEVESAADGGQGLEMALRSRPEVALVDIGLPGINGYEMARQVRAALGRNCIYLVALTGYGQPDDRRRALEAGFDAHLVKPIKPDELSRLLIAAPARS